MGKREEERERGWDGGGGREGKREGWRWEPWLWVSLPFIGLAISLVTPNPGPVATAEAGLLIASSFICGQYNLTGFWWYCPPEISWVQW